MQRFFRNSLKTLKRASNFIVVSKADKFVCEKYEKEVTCLAGICGKWICDSQNCLFQCQSNDEIFVGEGVKKCQCFQSRVLLTPTLRAF